MHIILGDQITKEITDKYIVLELDHFQITDRDQAVSAYCLIENVPIAELPQADQFRDLHANLIRNYRLGNWKFCEDALQHLQGRWNGEVDSFYHELGTRITNLRNQQPDHSSWNPAIKI
jgi:hypothetical protein